MRRYKRAVDVLKSVLQENPEVSAMTTQEAVVFMEQKITEFEGMNPNELVQSIPTRASMASSRKSRKDSSKDFPPTTPYRNNSSSQTFFQASTRAKGEQQVLENEDDYFNELAGSREKLEILMSQLGCSPFEMQTFLEEFRKQNELVNKVHVDFCDYVNHFRSFCRMRMIANRKASEQNSKQRSSYQQYSRYSRYEARKAAIDKRCREFVADAERRIAALS